MLLKVILLVGSLAVVTESYSKNVKDINGCYAPPAIYGGECFSSTSIFGAPGYKVTYSISQVNTVATLICCQVQACGPVTGTTCSTWGLYDVGCSSSSIDVTVPWGDNVATPGIRCYAVGTGTSLRWSP